MIDGKSLLEKMLAESEEGTAQTKSADGTCKACGQKLPETKEN